MSVVDGTFDVSGFIDAQPVHGRQYAVTVLCALVMFLDPRYAINQLCGATHRQRVDLAASGAGTNLCEAGRSATRKDVMVVFGKGVLDESMHESQVRMRRHLRLGAFDQSTVSRTQLVVRLADGRG